MFITDFVKQLTDLGYSPIPAYDSGKTQKYGHGEQYPHDVMLTTDWGNTYSPWEKASKIGLRLDELILIDYDGNHAEGKRPDLTLGQLAKTFGLESLKPALSQWGIDQDGNYNGSFHFLFRLPARLNFDNYFNSQDGKIRGVDVKTGNQLMWIKKNKVQNLLRVEDIPPATRQMVDFLRRPPEDSARNGVKGRVKLASESQERGYKWLEAAVERTAGMTQNRNSEFNKTVLAACRHALANEFSMDYAEQVLKDAARASGLEKNEIKDTWRSASVKARREGPKNLLERPRK